MVVVTVHTLASHAHTCVGDTSTLGWVDDAVAQSYMNFLLQRVRVLLPRHGWYVAVLKEFYPRSPALLGLNTGQGREVCVRFRVPGVRGQFLPFHEVLCTTLHELAHCQHARHDRLFWRLYYQLVRECEVLELQMVERGVPLYPPHVRTAHTQYTSTQTTRAATVRQGQQQRSGGARTTTATTTGRAGTRVVRTRKAATVTRTQTSSSAAPRAIKPRVTPQTVAVAHRLGSVVCNGGNNDNNSGRPQDAVALRDVLAAAIARRRTRAVAEAAAAAHEASDKDEARSSVECAPRVSLLAHARVAALPDVVVQQRESARYDSGTPVVACDATMATTAASWTCARCTYCNDGDSVVCAMCTDDLGADDDDDSGATTTTTMATVPVAYCAPVTTPLQRSSCDDDVVVVTWSCAGCTYNNTLYTHNNNSSGDVGGGDDDVHCDMCDAPMSRSARDTAEVYSNKRNDADDGDGDGRTADTAICIADDEEDEGVT